MVEQADGDGIAVVGMACVFPGAHSPEALWQDVLAGRRAFRKAPAERLPLESYHDPRPGAADKTYSDQIAVITDWIFDPQEFQVPPITADATDPTHWLALWTARDALRDAKVDLALVDRSRVGVVIGNTLGGEYGRSLTLRLRWPFIERALRRAIAGASGGDLDPGTVERLIGDFRQECLDPIPRITEDTLAGAMSNTIAGRICNYFDLRGGGYAVDGACSSSLLAVAKACEALADGDLDLVLAGGVDISLDPFELVGFAKTRALAREDIRPYDERADGMLPGEGCGIVVLVRAEDARSAGLSPRAWIRGWGYSSDGRGAMTAPRLEGQIEAMRRAYRRAGYPMSTVGLVEGHGTGTALGDQVELTAILAMLGDHGDGAAAEGCRIGSIKGNIGHCKAAAGAAGLIKAIMALRRKILPPAAGCEHPHALFGRPFGPLVPAMTGEVWAARSVPRRASVSAFGFGGSNAHLTLEEVDPDSPSCLADLELLGSARASELVLVSADDVHALALRIDRLREIARRIARAELTDLAAELGRADRKGRWRVAIVADSPWRLAERLDRVKSGLSSSQPIEAIADPSRGLFVGVPDAGSQPRLAAVFPGQGPQRVGMGWELAGTYAFVRELYERLDSAVADIVPEGLMRLVLKDTRGVDDACRMRLEAELRDTRLAQPAIVACSLAALRVLEHCGLTPDIHLGHSLGEITALCAAGACSETAAVRMAALRGRAMSELRLEVDGAMAAVAVDAAALSELIVELQSRVWIANYNSPRQTVVSGDAHSVSGLVAECLRRGIHAQRLPVSHAFHSPIVAPAANRLRGEIGHVPLRLPRSSVVSTVTGRFLATDVDLNRLLADHVTAPVLFRDAVKSARATAPAMWVEVGPGGVLTGLLEENLADSEAPVLASDHPGTDSFTRLNAVVGQAYVLGFPIRFDRLFGRRFSRPFSIENYAPSFIVNPCERPVSRPADASPSPAILPPAASGEEPDPTAFVIDWIATRTGFSASSITPDKRLRDDLNLDSIKATELVQVLLTRYGRGIEHQAGWQNLRISELVEAVLDSATSGTGSMDSEGRFTSSFDRSDDFRRGGDWVRTFAMRLEDAPLEGEPVLDPPQPRSVLIIAHDDCRYVRGAMDSLIDAGFAPVVVEAGKLLTVYSAAPTVGAIVWLLPPSGPSLSAIPASGSRGDPETIAEPLFRMARWLLSGPVGRVIPLRLVVVRPDIDPRVRRTSDAGAAFLRSLALEYPRLRFKWLRVPTRWDPGRCGQVVAEELRRGGQRGEYLYDDATSRRLVLAARLARDEGPGLVLDARDVVLASGGAKGITEALASALAREYGAKLALIGRSKPGDAAVRNAIALLRKAGIDAHYSPCDVTDARQVQQAVEFIGRVLGPVTAVLHGAGETSPVPFGELTLETCLRRIDVKAIGLANLIASCPPQNLKALHVVSSVLGDTGMMGQADYAFANAWLNAAMAELMAEHPHLHVVSLGYSLWRGAGVGENLGVVDILTGMGVTAIEVERGVAAYQAVLRGHCAEPRQIITGRLPPALESALYPVPPRCSSRFHERVLRWIPGVEMVVESALSLERDPYLRDHVLEGTPIFPAVMGIEAMVATAMAVAERAELPRLRDVEFRLPVIVPEGSTVPIRVYAIVVDDVEGCQAVEVAVRAATDGFAQDRMSATCLFDAVASDPKADDLESPIPPPLLIDMDGVARNRLFQGSFFRRLSGIRRLQPHESCLADVSLPAGLEYFREDLRHPSKTPFPAARDAFFQTILLVTGGPGVLTRIDELRFLPRSSDGDTVLCRTRLRSTDAARWTFDVDVFTSQGELIEVLRGIEGKAAGRKAETPSRLEVTLR